MNTEGTARNATAIGTGSATSPAVTGTVVVVAVVKGTAVTETATGRGTATEAVEDAAKMITGRGGHVTTKTAVVTTEAMRIMEWDSQAATADGLPETIRTAATRRDEVASAMA